MRVSEEAYSQVMAVPTKAVAIRRLGPDCTESAEEPEMGGRLEIGVYSAGFVEIRSLTHP